MIEKKKKGKKKKQAFKMYIPLWLAIFREDISFNVF